MNIAVAIDGPSGAGKSTIAKAVAKKMNFIYVDTGAMYRAIGLYVYRKGVDGKNSDEVIKLLSEINIALSYVGGTQRVILNGEDVSDLIRTPVISMYASKVSAISAVRAFLLQLQRDMALTNNVIMDGRDIGTVILPNACVKIFLTASAEKRAERRYLELTEKGEAVTLDEVLMDMRKRDDNDASRLAAPLKQADDAVLVDTTAYNLDESIDIITQIIKSKIS